MSDPLAADSQWVILHSRFQDSWDWMEPLIESETDPAMQSLLGMMRTARASAQEWLDSDRSTDPVTAMYRGLTND